MSVEESVSDLFIESLKFLENLVVDFMLSHLRQLCQASIDTEDVLKIVKAYLLEPASRFSERVATFTCFLGTLPRVSTLFRERQNNLAAHSGLDCAARIASRRGRHIATVCGQSADASLDEGQTSELGKFRHDR